MSCTLNEAEIERDLRFAIDCARAAGVRASGLRDTGRWEKKMLADIGDQANDGYLQGCVHGRYPDDGILSEETVDSADRLEKTRCWIVDPLDGTREFSQVREDWAVHVALTIEGRCALAAVALPSKSMTLWGVCMPGHERAGIDGAAQNLVPGDSDSPDPPRIAVSRSHTPPWIEGLGESLGATLVPAGSAGYKASLLLLGEADIYVHKKGLKEWDTCAPETVARSLGWKVSHLRGEEHAYNQADPRNDDIVFCRPEWHARVIETLAQVGALATD